MSRYLRLSAWGLLVVLGLVGTAVHAQDNGLYLGAGLGHANVEVADQGLEFDGSDTGYKIIVGFRPLNWLGIEANYVDFGEPDDAVAGVNLAADSTGISAFALGFLPAGPVDLYAKAGLINWDATLRAPSFPGLSTDADGTDFAYGAGVQFRIWSLSIRGEYEIFDIEDLDDVNLLSIGVTWTFL